LTAFFSLLTEAMSSAVTAVVPTPIIILAASVLVGIEFSAGAEIE
jgi:hypothetical protein